MEAMHSGEVVYPELRRQKAHQVHDSLKATGLHHSNQFAMWGMLEEAQRRLPWPSRR